jgi:hypothetical protein
LTAAAPAASPVLRPDQAKRVAPIRAAFAKLWRVLFVLLTGGGKAAISTYDTLHAVATRNRVLAHCQEITDPARR